MQRYAFINRAMIKAVSLIAIRISVLNYLDKKLNFFTLFLTKSITF